MRKYFNLFNYLGLYEIGGSWNTKNKKVGGGGGNRSDEKVGCFKSKNVK